ncbi:FecR family protein [Polaromonas sp. OV174]|uniref:FecR family protein n=1 Tax=Polaromonas sp. OV174 TaxID=1855300 RepID=UPI0008ED6E63|nr:FecR domain-containing protein [Polaromonas sp. OV174]SFB71972.1 FecR family protein [Polaromonas sp. OV174]
MKLYSCLWSLIFACGLSVLSCPAQAQPEPVAYVKTVVGEAWITTLGQRVKAELGTAVMIGSLIKTQPAASLGVTFKDNTVMSFGPDTEMTVDEYVYAPAQGQLKLATQMGKGTLNYVSGVIAKLKPEAVTIKTPSGIIGVRGTQFLLQVEEAK